jgi:hypothetical protein
LRDLLLFNRRLQSGDLSGLESLGLLLWCLRNQLPLLLPEKHLSLSGIGPFDSSSKIPLKPIKVLLCMGSNLGTGPRPNELLDAPPILTK